MQTLPHLHEDLDAGALHLDAGLPARVDALLPPNVLPEPRYSSALQAQIDTELLAGETVAA